MRPATIKSRTSFSTTSLWPMRCWAPFPSRPSTATVSHPTATQCPIHLPMARKLKVSRRLWFIRQFSEVVCTFFGAGAQISCKQTRRFWSGSCSEYRDSFQTHDVNARIRRETLIARGTLSPEDFKFKIFVLGTLLALIIENLLLIATTRSERPRQVVFRLKRLNVGSVAKCLITRICFIAFSSSNSRRNFC